MATSRNGRQRDPEPRDLSNWGISDTEILAIVVDVGDPDGWATTYDVRIQLGEKPEESRHRTGVPSRLSWLRRYGWLERNEDGLWRLTPIGHAILDKPNLPKAVAGSLGKLNPAQRLTLTRELGETGNDQMPEVRTAIRRQVAAIARTLRGRAGGSPTAASRQAARLV